MRKSASVIVVTFSVALLCLAGCNDKTTRRRSSTGGTTEGASVSAAAARCQQLLTNGLSQLEPAKLGISATPRQASMGLNAWLKKCGADSWTDGWSQDITGVLGEEVATRSELRKFRESDSLHIRTCFLLRSYAKDVAGDSETERITNLFYKVVRDVALQERDFPLSPFEILATGRGTAKDRAWLFVSALRQRRVDAFVLQPEGTEIQQIVGVVNDDKVLLFDTALGLPIFKSEDEIKTAWPRTAVALADINDETLGGLSVDGHPYEVKAEQLQNATVLLAGGPAVWAHRSLVLQDALTGDQVATLCDPLQDIGEAPGLITRIKEAGGWDADRIKLWAYPLEQIGRFGRMSEAEQNKFDQLINPLRARVVRNKTEDGTAFKFTRSVWELFEARVDQLQGDDSEAVPTRIQNIRLGKLEREVQSSDEDGLMVRNPEEFVVLHNRAAEDAYIYLVTFLLRGQDYQAAVDTARQYKRDYYVDTPEEGANWKKGYVNYLLAMAHESAGEPGFAYRAMKAAVEAGDADKHGQAILLERLKTLAGDLANEVEPQADVAVPVNQAAPEKKASDDGNEENKNSEVLGSKEENADSKDEKNKGEKKDDDAREQKQDDK